MDKKDEALTGWQKALVNLTDEALAQPEAPQAQELEFLVEAECKKCGAKETGIAKLKAPQAQPETGAKMPCGALVTNVYEAYEAGKKAAQAQPVQLTDEQIDKGQWDDGTSSSADFKAGVRFAEAAHGIGVSK